MNLYVFHSIYSFIYCAALSCFVLLYGLLDTEMSMCDCSDHNYRHVGIMRPIDRCEVTAADKSEVVDPVV